MLELRTGFGAYHSFMRPTHGGPFCCLTLQVSQEKEVMRENRLLRERQYAERRERDWEETLRREVELHRCGSEHERVVCSAIYLTIALSTGTR